MYVPSNHDSKSTISNASKWKVNYCKTLIIGVTLFSQGQKPRFIHETLFSRFFIYSSLVLALEIIGEDFIFVSICSREFTQK